MIVKNWKFILFCCLIELAIVIFISIACLFNNSIYYIFYNLIYGIVISVLLPLLILLKEKKNFEEVGIKKLGKREFIVLFSFVLFSIGGQIIPKTITGEQMSWNVLPIAILPLIMTTFFEEFLFRGFIQTRIEKEFGYGIAIIISGLLFSLYHLGYPGFRTFSDIMLLFVVGIAFAIAFKLSNNNFVVSYFVNLPNAFVTYILKYSQFPKMTIESTIYAGITIILLVIIFVNYRKQIQKDNKLKII